MNVHKSQPISLLTQKQALQPFISFYILAMASCNYTFQTLGVLTLAFLFCIQGTLGTFTYISVV